MVSAGNISWTYLIFGIMASGLIAVSSYKVKLIEKKSELLYMSFGFYRNFLQSYFDNFFSSLTLVIALAFRREPFKPVIRIVNFGEKHRINLALFATTINMTTGLFCIALRESEIFIHEAEDDYFTRFNLAKLMKQLAHVNDDNLV